MDRDTSALTAAQRRHVRTARAMTVYSVCATPVIVVLWPLAEMAQTHGNGNPLWPQTVSLVLLLASCACMGPLIAARMRGEGVPDPRLYAASVLLAWTGALFLREETYMVCALASWLSVMTHLHRGARYPAVLGAATGFLPWIAWPFLHPDSPFAALLFVWLVGALLWGLFYLGCAVSFRLWDIVREAFSAQEAKARLAVAVERLRFTRDLQDLLGQDLNVLAVRAARAGRNVSRDPEQARAEAAEVHALARDALRRIRTAVSGYRELELAGEVRSVTAVLAAGGVRTSVAGLADLDPSPAEASLAAWTVREGGARLLRHGTAAHCRISFSRDPATGRAVVELSGDRARPGADPEPGGADGFADRVRREGGALTAGRTPEGGLLLRVRLPLDGSPSPAGEAR